MIIINSSFRKIVQGVLILITAIGFIFQCSEEPEIGYSSEFKKKLNTRMKAERFQGEYALVKNGQLILRSENSKKQKRAKHAPGLEQYFLCVGILRLQEKNILSIDDSISEYLSEDELTKWEEYSHLSIRSFMNQTSGLGSNLTPGEYWFKSKKNKEILRLIILNLMDRTSKMDRLEEFFSTEFFQPLDMKFSRFHSSRGLEITVEDLIKWEIAWSKNFILPASSIEAMTEPTVLKDNYATNRFQYGLGLYTNKEYHWISSTSKQPGILYYRIQSENIGIIIYHQGKTSKGDLISWKSIITESIYNSSYLNLKNDNEVLASLQERKVPAMGISIVENHSIVFSQNYGVLENGNPTPVTKHTLFRAGSLSKPITALTYMIQSEKHKRSLNENLNKFSKGRSIDLSHWKAGEKLTPNVLLSHSSGITERYGWSTLENKNIRSLKNLNNGKGSGLYAYYSPGKKSRYSGGGYSILQEHLTHFSQESFSKLTKNLIFQPNGMSRSTWVQDPNKLPEDRVSGHDNQAVAIPITIYSHVELGAGGLWTTPNDLARFFLSIQKCRISQCKYPSQIIDEMMNPVIPAANLSVHSWIGRGFFLNQSGRDWYFYHGGHSQGHKSMAIFHKKKGYGIVIMTNSEAGSPMIWHVIRSVFLEKKWDKFVN